MENLRGEMTAFLALIFILLISFAGSLMESVSIQSAKNYRRADMNRAVESVFAEYQKEMLEEFDLFVLEGSYESGSYSKDRIMDRLSYYGAGNMEHSIKRMEIITDRGGAPFLEQVNQWVKHKYGLDKLDGLLGEAQSWKSQSEEAKKFQKEEENQNQTLEDLLKENEQQLPTEDNPLNTVSGLKNSPLLNLVMPKEKTVSAKSVALSSMVFYRRLEEGYGDFQDVSDGIGASSLALGVYLLEHFKSAVSKEESDTGAAASALEYELEYILGGKGSDRENLEYVVQWLLAIRVVPNYIYLQSDSAKKAEARAMALTLCTLLAVPAITEAVMQALLFAWAFGESVVDIRALLDGRKVPLTKDRQSWQLQLSALSRLGEEGEWNSGQDSEKGLDYTDYIRILLFLQNTGQTARRSLNLMEQKLRTEKGFTWFRADYCITKIEFESVCKLRRGINYRFATYFGYN